MRSASISVRAFAFILPVALLLFGFSTWLAYQSSREREIASSMQLLAQDRALAQQALDLKFSELQVAQARARDRLLEMRRTGTGAVPDFDRNFPAFGDGTRRSRKRSVGRYQHINRTGFHGLEPLSLISTLQPSDVAICKSPSHRLSVWLMACPKT